MEILKFFIFNCYFFYFNRSGIRILAHFMEETCKKYKAWTIEVKKEVEKIFFISKQQYLLRNLFWPTVRKNCSSDQEKLLKFKAEGREFAKFLRSLEQFIQTVKGQNNFW